MASTYECACQIIIALLVPLRHNCFKSEKAFQLMRRQKKNPNYVDSFPALVSLSSQKFSAEFHAWWRITNTRFCPGCCCLRFLRFFWRGKQKPVSVTFCKLRNKTYAFVVSSFIWLFGFCGSCTWSIFALLTCVIETIYLYLCNKWGGCVRI